MEGGSMKAPFLRMQAISFLNCYVVPSCYQIGLVEGMIFRFADMTREIISTGLFKPLAFLMRGDDGEKDASSLKKSQMILNRKL